MRAVIRLEDVGCPGSGRSLERTLERVPGVIRAYANPATEQIYVDYDPDKVGIAELERVVIDAGYPISQQAEA